MARPDPRQPSMLDALERATPTVTPAEDAKVRAYVADILPRGVPTYVRRVLAVRPYKGGRDLMGPADGFEADIEVFDGRPATVRISGRLGEAGYAWSLPEGDEAFYWDDRRSAWRRLSKAEAAKRRAA
ncbi:protein of unknown function [Methylorubrum extorquens]|uniref:Uncharacterized protein n=1 Tax=Methylorubrum extorquens TaxID=408 RepID=A0A2N9ATW7_METEX|nr:protein of unknown function [Methylorubrum extorquens]